jgi:thiamine monophosphate synthase
MVVKTGASKIALTNALMYAQIPEETAQEFINILQ